MFKFLYSSGLSILLNIFRLFNVISGLIDFMAYRTGSIIDGILGEILGFNDDWYFFDGHVYPIQSKNLNLESRKDATWRYNKRTNVWYPIGIYSSKHYVYYPWISGSVYLLTDKEEGDGIEFECTKFLNNQKIHCIMENVKDYPYPYHLFGAWCLHNKVSFREEEIVNMRFDVFTMDAENVSIPIYTYARKDYEDFFKSIGSSCEEEMVTFESDEDSGVGSDNDSGPDAAVFAADLALDTVTNEEVLTLLKEPLPVMDMGILRARQNTSISEPTADTVEEKSEEVDKFKNE